MSEYPFTRCESTLNPPGPYFHVQLYFILSYNTMPWLMKAEPDSRIVKGKDVKVSLGLECGKSCLSYPNFFTERKQFGIDDFEAIGYVPSSVIRLSDHINYLGMPETRVGHHLGTVWQISTI